MSVDIEVVVEARPRAACPNNDSDGHVPWIDNTGLLVGRDGPAHLRGRKIAVSLSSWK